jgi:hypothetical protein
LQVAQYTQIPIFAAQNWYLSVLSLIFVFGVAERIELAIGAAGFTGYAKRPAVVNQLQRKLDPLLLGDDLHQILLDGDWIGILGQVQPPRHALHVRIHYDPGRDSIVAAQNDISCFTSGSRNRDQLLHGLGDLAIEISENLPGGADKRFGFIAEKTGGPDVAPKFFQICVGEIGDGWIFLE